jgi:hypothetical protein
MGKTMILPLLNGHFISIGQTGKPIIPAGGTATGQ